MGRRSAHPNVKPSPRRASSRASPHVGASPNEGGAASSETRGDAADGPGGGGATNSVAQLALLAVAATASIIAVVADESARRQVSELIAARDLARHIAEHVSEHAMEEADGGVDEATAQSDPAG